MGKPNAPESVTIRLGNSPNNLVTQVQVNKIECLCVIDIGATKTILHPRTISRMTTRPAMKITHSFIQTVTGETSPVQGILEVDLQVGTFLAKYSMFVAPISDDCILGMDFLRQHSCVLDLQKYTLQIGS